MTLLRLGSYAEQATEEAKQTLNVQRSILNGGKRTDSMRLIINGETIERPAPCSLEALLRDLKLKDERVATVVNDDVVPSGLRAARQVQGGDRIEILTFAGGG